MKNGTTAAAGWLVGITDRVPPPGDIERKAFPEAEFVFLPDWREGEEAAAEWKNVEALLVWHRKIDQQAVDLLDRCRIAVRYGVGYDVLDLKALNARGIPACNTPDYGTEEVADTASAMIMTLQRKILSYDRASRYYAQGWQEHTQKPLERTSERTLGVIGVGRIGTAVINRMKPFGFKILGYDPYQVSGHEKAVGYRRVNMLEELLGEADLVTLHCPLTDETDAMVDEQFFRLMKPGASLVNTARGKILKDLDCLEDTLKSGHLASVALDVLPDEPPRDHSLIRAWRDDEEWLRGRLIINPHAAFYSERAFYEMRYKAAETVRMYLLTGRLRNHLIQ
jgi:D-3-phosphoglycerate dehydrogenase